MYQPSALPNAARLLGALLWYVGLAFWVESTWATKRAQSLTRVDAVTADVQIAGLSVGAVDHPWNRTLRYAVRIDIAKGPLVGESYWLSDAPYPPLRIGDQLRITYDPLQPGIFRRKWLRAASQGDRVLMAWQSGKINAKNNAPAFAIILQLLLLITFWRFALPWRKSPDAS